MKILLIENLVDYHYEIIESIIIKYNDILKLNDTTDIQIYLNIYDNKDYKSYITTKYPEPIIFIGKPEKYDFYINCTFYAKNLPNLINNNLINSSTHYYISHNFDNNTIKYSNIYYLSPLSNTNRIITADILPFSNEKKSFDFKLKSKEPIFLIQGAINKYRRDLSLIKKILSINISNKPFKLKLLGKYNRLPPSILQYKNKLIIKKNLNFIDYHKELLDCYAIIPAISKSKQPQYYSTKLTSSINYANGYSLPCLIDKDLQEIYSLNNAYVYSNDNIIVQFKKLLDLYY